MSRSQPVARWAKSLLGCALVLPFVAGACRRPPVEVQARPGTARSYRLSLVTTVVPPGQAKIEKTSFQGVLNVSALTAGRTRALGFQLSDLDVRRGGAPAPTVAKALSAPFRIDLSQAGQLGRSHFLPETARGERASLDGLVRALEVVLPSRRAVEWESSENDRNGDYEAAYKLEPQPGRLTKTKRRYTSVREAGWVSLHVLDSTLRAELDPELWLRSAELHEKLEIRGQRGLVAATVEAETRLQALPPRPAPSLPLMQESTQAKLTSPYEDPSAPATSAWDELAQEERREEFVKAGVTLDVLLGRIERRDLPRSTLSLQMSAYLQAFPEEAKALSAKLEHLPAASAELLTNAMVQAGTPQAEASVLDLLKQAETANDRVKLLLTLGTAPNPSPRFVEAAFAMFDVSRAEGSWEVAGAAARALSRLGTRKSAVQAAVASGLRDRLGKTDKAREQQLLLEALPSCDPPLSVPEVTRYLGSSAIDVRVAAAGLLGTLTGPRATAELEALLAAATDERIRRAALLAMSNGPVDEPRSAIAARWLTEKQTSVDSGTREALVRYLARGMPSVPRNRERLQAILKQEASRPVLAAILNALAGDSTKTPRYPSPSSSPSEESPERSMAR